MSYNSQSSSNKKKEETASSQGLPAKAAGVVAGIAAVGVGIAGLYSVFSSKASAEPSKISSIENNESTKMMNAPGRDCTISRSDFEKDPSSYFRGLRNK